MVKRYMIWWLLLALCSGACRKFVQVSDPSSSLGTAAVFSGDETATAALIGMYSRAMASPGAFLNGGNSIFPSLSADECKSTQSLSAMDAFTNNALISNNPYIATLYGSAYNAIYNANMLSDNLIGSKQVSPGVRRQILGEALFLRALVYSRLATLWGDVPLLTTTNADVNAIAPRMTLDSIYHQVMKDLQQADTLLDIAYVWSGKGVAERTRPNRWAARTLIARTTLNLRMWTEAETAASAVIDSGGYRLESSLDSVFLSVSREAIWQLQPVSNVMNSAEGYYYLPVDNVQAKPAYVLTPALLQAFEVGDKRRARWVGTKNINGIVYAYPAKYKIRTGPPYSEYNMVLRLAEVYLIRAEARTQQGDLIDAIKDLNVVRMRAGLAGLPDTLDQVHILAAIVQERRIELFAEWGHRWLDLKRWGMADAILSIEKPGWANYAKLYPMPLIDIQRNPYLMQNAGY